MEVPDLIHQEVKRLPKALQIEVHDFAIFLAEHEAVEAGQEEPTVRHAALAWEMQRG